MDSNIERIADALIDMYIENKEYSQEDIDMLEKELSRIIDGIVISSKNKDLDATMAYVTELEELVGADTAEVIFNKVGAMLDEL